MWIDELSASGVGGLEHLELNFDSNFNIICGPNGIGKTTVLECVAHCFSRGSTQILKRNAKLEKAEITAQVKHGDEILKANINFQEFDPRSQAQIMGLGDYAHYLFSLKVARSFAYQELDAIHRDREKRENHQLWNDARRGVSMDDIKSWFCNRYMYMPHDTLTDTQVKNFELSKSAFSLLDPTFDFSHVDPSTNEIIVSTPTGDIFYEYLSSGFKSCLSLIFGIIKEIEIRFYEPRISADSFDGVILIDELELHLHPAWQARISGVLKELFPGSQFICTTHSPHVIQTAAPEEIIALEKKDGLVQERELTAQESVGFKGWTIEEVLVDVMGMEDVRTPLYNERMTEFNSAIDQENWEKARSIFHDLDAMLHPNNVMRKIIQMQLDSVLPQNEDDARHD